MYKQIVVGTDGSPGGNMAVDTAIELARLTGASLHVVTAHKMTTSYHLAAATEVGIAAADIVESNAVLRERGQQVCDQAVERADQVGVSAVAHCVSGDAAEALLKVAEDAGCDLLVVGTRGMAGVRRMLGSVPNKLSHHCPSSLLIVDTTEAQRVGRMPDVVKDLAALAPKLAERGDDIAAARQLPADVVGTLRDAGAFRIAAAHALGGPELSPREQTEVVETLSYHEASVGWCTMIGSDAPYYGSFLAPEAAAELWPTIDCVTAGQIPPNGQARRADGGYVVNGRWAFGSGSTHAEVIVGGCILMDGDTPVFIDGRPDFLVACAPAASWNVLDTWHTTGLAGSGSNDYTATDLFVPENHVFRFSDPVHRPEPLYGWPGMFFVNMPGVPLGLARRAIDVAVGIVSEKLLMPEMVLLRDTSRARLAIAHAEAQLGSARAYAYDALDRFWDALLVGDEPSIELRVAVALSRAHAFRVAREVAEAMSDLIGASSIYESHPLERLVRDAITMSQHLAAQERMFEMIGELSLTGASTMPLL